MAFTIAQAARSKDTAGIRQRRLLDFTGPASYTTGGETLSANAVGLGTIEHIPDFILTNGTASVIAHYNRSTGKLQCLQGSPGTPAGTVTMDAYTPAGTNSKPSFTVESSGAIGSNMEVGLSADSAAATFEGGTGITAQRALTTTSPVGTPTFTGTQATLTGAFAGTAGAGVGLVEVASLANLSAYSGRVEVIGK